MAEQYSTVQVCHCLFIQSPPEGHLSCFQVLIIMNKTALYRFLCEYKISFLWDKCPGVQLLGCMVVAGFVL